MTALAAGLLLGQEPGGRGGCGGKGGPQPQATQMVKPGLYMITGAGANSEIPVTNEGLILVDGKLPGEQNYNALMDQIKMISPQPINYLIVTHHHADHTGKPGFEGFRKLTRFSIWNDSARISTYCFSLTEKRLERARAGSK